MKKLSYLFVLGLLLAYACSDSLSESVIDPPDAPFNPFDTVNYDVSMIPEIEVDSHTILGLHYHIISKRCNQPGCHDGSFEPDYRTVQSTYSTLVYHGIEKNYVKQRDGLDPLLYRVMPGEPDQSMLYHRITQDRPQFEQMPSSGIPLEQREIDLIREWIENGAPDIYGKPATYSSIQPICYGLLAYNEQGQRLDSIRGNFEFNPFLVRPSDGAITLWFLYLDVNPARDTLFGNALTHNKIKISNDAYDFSNAVELDMTVPLFPKLEPSAFSQPLGFPVPYYQNITFNPADYGFGVGDIVYLRTYVQDSDHSSPTELPESEMQFVLLTYFSFVIQ